MEQCPECKNVGWKPIKGYKNVLKNFGKIKHRTFSIRYYVCLNCGHRFKTIERYYQDVNSPDLFSQTEEA